MIRSISFKPDFYASKLECIGDRKFEFPQCPSLTFLYGPNGCGKSTIIKGLARGSSILEKGGWSSPPEPLQYGIGEDKSDPLKVLGKNADVDWDGTPSIFMDSSASDNTGGTLELEDGIGDSFMSGVMKATGGGSSGEWRLNRLVELVKMLNKKQYQDLTVPIWQDMNSSWSGAGTSFSAYVKKLKNTGIPTVLLDEPDRSLSMVRSHELVSGLLPKMAKDLQVIVATHSFFCLFVDNANVIDLQDGYASETKRLLKRMLRRSGE